MICLTILNMLITFLAEFMKHTYSLTLNDSLQRGDVIDNYLEQKLFY